MSTYVMSDIHGRYDRYLKMLDLVEFGNDDNLYIIGDVIDYGSFSIDLMKDIMKRDNVTLTMGDHEYMMLRSLYKSSMCHYEWESIYRNWMNSGGEATLKALLKLPDNERYEIFQYFDNVSMFEVVTINNDSFYLVHAFPAHRTFDVLSTKVDLSMLNPIEGTELIIGHTPVPELYIHNERLYERYQSKHRHYEIEYAPGFTNIDCGCKYEDDPKSRLACLRLDDMEEFYVK